MSGLLRKITGFILVAIAITAMPGEAMAAAAKLGDVITNARTSTTKVTLFISMLSYFSGAMFCMIGIFKMKDHVDNPGQTPISMSLKRFLAGGMLLSLPFMAQVVKDTVSNGSTVVASGSSTGLDPTIVNPDALDGMVVKLMSDVAVPMEMALQAFAYIFATAFLFIGINRLTKRMDEGPRGPAGMGTIMTFIVAGVFFSYGHVMAAFTNTLFSPGVSGRSSTAAVFDAGKKLGLNATDQQRIEQVIQALMLFIVLVGMIAFIRGWLVLRAFADGQQGATLAQGLTFLFGGALAINLGDLVNVLQASLGVSGITFK